MALNHSPVALVDPHPLEEETMLLICPTTIESTLLFVIQGIISGRLCLARPKLELLLGIAEKVVTDGCCSESW